MCSPLIPSLFSLHKRYLLLPSFFLQSQLHLHLQLPHLILLQSKPQLVPHDLHHSSNKGIKITNNALPNPPPSHHNIPHPHPRPPPPQHLHLQHNLLHRTAMVNHRLHSLHRPRWAPRPRHPIHIQRKPPLLPLQRSQHQHHDSLH